MHVLPLTSSGDSPCFIQTADQSRCWQLDMAHYLKGATCLIFGCGHSAHAGRSPCVRACARARVPHSSSLALPQLLLLVVTLLLLSGRVAGEQQWQCHTGTLGYHACRLSLLHKIWSAQSTSARVRACGCRLCFGGGG
mgnify:FL=1